MQWLTPSFLLPFSFHPMGNRGSISGLLDFTNSFVAAFCFILKIAFSFSLTSIFPCLTCCRANIGHQFPTFEAIFFVKCSALAFSPRSHKFGSELINAKTFSRRTCPKIQFFFCDWQSSLCNTWEAIQWMRGAFVPFVVPISPLFEERSLFNCAHGLPKAMKQGCGLQQMLSLDEFPEQWQLTCKMARICLCACGHASFTVNCGLTPE